MQKILFRRYQGILVCGVALAVMLLITACSSSGNTVSGQPTTTTGTGATPTTATQVSPTASSTQPTVATATPVPVAFKPGGISFIGPVKSSSASSVVMSGPDGKSYTLAIAPTTDLSGYNGAPPAVGASVNMDASANPDGSFTATTLKPAVQGDPDFNVFAYIGITTSAVGADRVIHFTSGTKAYIFTIPTTAVLTDFGGNAQAIGINTTVKVKVLFPAKTVVSIGIGP